MKILHIRSSEFFGGPESAILGQCLSMSTDKLAVASFVKNDCDNRFLDECKKNNIETFIIPESFTGDPGTIGKIKKLLLDQKFDLVVTHDYKANFYTYYAARKLLTGHIAHFRGRTAEDFKVKIYNAIDWRMLRKIKRVFVVAESARNLLVSKGVKDKNIRTLFNAIIVDDEPIIRGKKNGYIRIITAGRLSYEKGYDLLVKSAGLIKDKAPAFKISIYGDGPELNNLQRLIADLGLDSCVELCGFVDDVKPALAQSDFMVIPSRSEGMPNILLEAWAKSLGVLSTKVGAIPDMIADGKNGLLADVDNVEKLADRLLYALVNVEKMYQFGVEGYHTVKDRFNYIKQAELLGELYSEFLNETGRHE